MGILTFFIFNLYVYGVFPLEMRNVDTTVVAIITDYLCEELSAYGSVLGRDIVKDALYELKGCLTDTCLLRFSEKYDVKNIVLLYIDRLGEKYIVRIKVFNSDKKKFVFNQKDVADKESDLDILMQRFAEAIYEGKPVEEVITTETITALESEKEPRKRITRKYFSGRVGTLFPTSGFYDDQNTTRPKNLTRFILGFHYEVKKTAIGAEWTFFSRGSGFEFPLRFFTSNEDYTSYLEIAPGYYLMPDVYKDWNEKIAGGNGPSIGLGVGYAIFHTYDVQFIVNLRYLLILNNGPDSGIEFTFGLLFGKG